MIVDICGLVDLEIDERIAGYHDMIASLGDVPGLAAAAQETIASQHGCRTGVRVQYEALDSTRLRDLGDDIYVSDGMLFDRDYGVQWRSAPNGTVHLGTSHSGLEWIIWSIQLALLRQNHAFIHCAGVERGGAGVLFPSWGGVGKTALAKGFVSDRGWRLLGDDLVVLSSTGRCYGFPKPMVLYPYHQVVFPEVFRSGYGPKAPITANFILTRLAVASKPVLRRMPGVLAWARAHNPQSTRVAPSKVFGFDRLAATAELQTVVWLDRVPGLARPQLTPAEGNIVSRLVGSTLREFDQRCVSVTNVAFGLGLWDFADVYPRWYEAVGSALAGKEHWILKLPANLPVAEVAGVVMRELESVVGRGG